MVLRQMKKKSCVDFTYNDFVVHESLVQMKGCLPLKFALLFELLASGRLTMLVLSASAAL